jgi:uncharacterized protein
MTAPLQFSLSELQEKPRSVDLGLDPELFGPEPLSDIAKLAGRVHVALQASLREGRVWLEGKATGRWELECVRCLSTPRVEYSVKIDAVIEEPPPVIDALEEVRQSLVLAVPTQPYCREDCKGLCPQCGANRNEKDCGHQDAPPSRFRITKRGRQDNA